MIARPPPIRFSVAICAGAQPCTSCRYFGPNVPAELPAILMQKNVSASIPNDAGCSRAARRMFENIGNGLVNAALACARCVNWPVSGNARRQYAMKHSGITPTA